ncbi:MAG: hypothetical protein ACI9VR_001015 [Cognaticolwellia sp.]|jgi:hypothetical protein
MKRLRIPFLVLCAFGTGLLAQGPLQAQAQSMFEKPAVTADGKIPDRFGSVVRYELQAAAAGSSRFAWVDLTKVAAVEGAQGSMNTWRTVIYLPGGPIEVAARHQDVMREMMKSRGEIVGEPAE